MKNRKTANGPSEGALTGARNTSGLTLAFLLVIAGCTPGRGGGVPVRVLLPQQPSSQPVAAGPGAPRVHVTVDPSSALPTVELHELMGWDRVPYSIQGRYGSVEGTTEAVVGGRVCAPPCDVVVDGRRGQEFFFAGSGVSESSRFRLAGEAGGLFFTVSPGRSTLKAVGIPVTAISGIGMLVGGTLMAVTAAEGGSGHDFAVGGAVLGASGALLGAGIALLLSGRTTYTLTRE